MTIPAERLTCGDAVDSVCATQSSRRIGARHEVAVPLVVVPRRADVRLAGR